MVVGERGTGGHTLVGVVDGGAGGLEGKGSGLGLGTVWRVYIKHSCCDLCCNVVLEVVRWWGGAVAWIYGDCLGEWMRKKMK